MSLSMMIYIRFNMSQKQTEIRKYVINLLSQFFKWFFLYIRPVNGNFSHEDKNSTGNHAGTYRDHSISF
jgi:hypothetical protein